MKISRVPRASGPYELWFDRALFSPLSLSLVALSNFRATKSRGLFNNDLPYVCVYIYVYILDSTSRSVRFGSFAEP